jgi:glycosyltransferase involved in cell wall biosynthesis
MKIALVHEWFVDWAGSESVVAQMLLCFPDAHLYSLVDFLSDADRARIGGRRAQTSFLQRAPFARSKLPYYLPLMPLAIEQLDLSNYDLIISSSHAVAKGVICGPDQIHLCYAHSPMRYAWDQQHQYLRGSLGSGLRGVGLRLLLHYLRIWDVRTAAGVDAFAANSAYVARRIRRTYRREAAVIHPPVDTERFKVRETKDSYFLCASRLMPYKRVDLVVEAFSRLPELKLVVIGDGPEYKSIARLAGRNVELLGYQSTESLIRHLQEATALVFAAEEDFGILPVEAQACGTPVIAFGRGGALETVNGDDCPSPTGILFQEQSVDALVQAIRQFHRNRCRFTAQACRQNAERFSQTVFRERFMDFVRSNIGSHGWTQPPGVMTSA